MLGTGDPLIVYDSTAELAKTKKMEPKKKDGEPPPDHDPMRDLINGAMQDLDALASGRRGPRQGSKGPGACTVLPRVEYNYDDGHISANSDSDWDVDSECSDMSGWGDIVLGSGASKPKPKPKAKAEPLQPPPPEPPPSHPQPPGPEPPAQPPGPEPPQPPGPEPPLPPPPEPPPGPAPAPAPPPEPEPPPPPPPPDDGDDGKGKGRGRGGRGWAGRRAGQEHETWLADVRGDGHATVKWDPATLQLTAHCNLPGHGRLCRLRKSIKASDTNRAQGRPGGYLLAWLAAAPRYATSADHQQMGQRKGANNREALRFEERLRLRQWAQESALDLTTAFAEFERPRWAGEGPEPEGFA